ncbi:MAG: Fur family transcriptional regulator [Peptococcaceae bacterium]|nr:transcriptional repressor [Peptococcaceae bacterium]MDH7524620.1 Fur family transcriptional regulator [Peptococcaceae bacterium]
MMKTKQADPGNTLKMKGLKSTPARRLMLTVFLKEKNRLYKPLEIFDQIRKTEPGVSFSTVYRNLESLVSHGIIEKITLEGAARYKLLAENTHRHHMICLLCHKTEPLPYCPVKQMEEMLKNSQCGFWPVEHRVEVYGYCKECRKFKALENPG